MSDAEDQGDSEVTSKVKVTEVAPTKPVANTSDSNKRQRTLAEMFGKPQKDAPAAKKQKLTASSSNNAIVISSLDDQPLNTMPFSVSAFLESLSDEHRKLLQLECDIMGNSWQVDLIL
jgi:uracil-DNA glycosylase